MKRTHIDLVVGIFMIIGFLCFAYLSLQFGESSYFSVNKGLALFAKFDSVSGLKKGADVEMSGVKIGKVVDISLGQDSRALIEMSINKNVNIFSDSMASIRSQGIIGDKYVRIIQGGSDKIMVSGSTITDTESTVDIEELISKYIFGKL